MNTNEELFEHYKFIADKGQVPIRLDKFLMDRIPNSSRTKIQQAIENGHTLVNNNHSKPGYKVKPDDAIVVAMPYPVKEIELVAENIPLNIVYEDNEVIVINKPSGMVVHPAYGHYNGTLVNALLYHYKSFSKHHQKGLRPGIVHRLDKNTSGLIVVAKNDTALTELGKQFFNRSTSRLYQALVWGIPKEKEGVIEGNIGRSLKNRKIMAIFINKEYGKHAITHYKLLQSLDYISHIECKLETGRTHQIRVHLKHLGCPLFNDKEYGGDRVLRGTTFNKYKTFVQNCFKAMPRQALHAKTLGFNQPKSGKWLSFDSPLPEDFTTVINKWQKFLSGRAI